MSGDPVFLREIEQVAELLHDELVEVYLSGK
jgi:hypothetical protein